MICVLIKFHEVIRNKIKFIKLKIIEVNSMIFDTRMKDRTKKI